MCNEIVTGRCKNRGIDAGVTTRSGLLEGDGEHFKELLASSGSIVRNYISRTYRLHVFIEEIHRGSSG